MRFLSTLRAAILPQVSFLVAGPVAGSASQVEVGPSASRGTEGDEYDGGAARTSHPGSPASKDAPGDRSRTEEPPGCPICNPVDLPADQDARREEVRAARSPSAQASSVDSARCSLCNNKFCVECLRRYALSRPASARLVVNQPADICPLCRGEWTNLPRFLRAHASGVREEDLEEDVPGRGIQEEDVPRAGNSAYLAGDPEDNPMHRAFAEHNERLLTEIRQEQEECCCGCCSSFLLSCGIRRGRLAKVCPFCCGGARQAVEGSDFVPRLRTVERDWGDPDLAATSRWRGSLLERNRSGRDVDEGSSVWRRAPGLQGHDGLVIHWQEIKNLFCGWWFRCCNTNNCILDACCPPFDYDRWVCEFTEDHCQVFRGASPPSRNEEPESPAASAPRQLAMEESTSLLAAGQDGTTAQERPSQQYSDETDIDAGAEQTKTWYEKCCCVDHFCGIKRIFAEKDYEVDDWDLLPVNGWDVFSRRLRVPAGAAAATTVPSAFRGYAAGRAPPGAPPAQQQMASPPGEDPRPGSDPPVPYMPLLVDQRIHQSLVNALVHQSIHQRLHQRIHQDQTTLEEEDDDGGTLLASTSRFAASRLRTRSKLILDLRRPCQRVGCCCCLTISGSSCCCVATKCCGLPLVPAALFKTASSCCQNCVALFNHKSALMCCLLGTTFVSTATSLTSVSVDHDFNCMDRERMALEDVARDRRRVRRARIALAGFVDAHAARQRQGSDAEEPPERRGSSSGSGEPERRVGRVEALQEPAMGQEGGKLSDFPEQSSARNTDTEGEIQLQIPCEV